MKARYKSILMSLLALVVGISLITGATLALFAKESKHNIVISTAKVELNADVKLLSYQDNTLFEQNEWADITAGDVDDNGLFVFPDSNGQVSVQLAEDSINMSGWRINDKIRFEVTVYNESSIDILYHLILKGVEDSGVQPFDIADFDLAISEKDTACEMLEFSAGRVGTAWQTTSPIAGDDKTMTTYTVELGLADNKLDGSVYGIAFTVEGVQANADVEQGATKLIESYEDFAEFAEMATTGEDFKGKTIVMNDDITLPETMSDGGWTPLCKSSRLGFIVLNGFKGIFDGQGHTIKGLKIDSNSFGADEGVGFFSSVKGGTVKNVNLEVDITATNECTGGIAGLVSDGGVIENCTVSGTIKSGRGIGGIVGRVIKTGKIIDCVNNAAITGTNAGGNVAGIVGAAYYAGSRETMVISGCVNNGDVQGAGNATAGIAGLLATGSVIDCTNNGNITANGGTSNGGIVGEARYGVEIRECDNNGAVVSKGSWTGGIVGWVRYLTDDTNYKNAYGIVAEISDCVNKGAISAEDYSLGGIVGGAYNNLIMTNCINEGTVAGKDVNPEMRMIAGILGNFQADLPKTEEDIPGNQLVGEVPSLIMTDCHNKNASITGGVGSYAGMTNGVIGHIADKSYGTFTGCSTVDEENLGLGY